jgi:ubiquinone/menaquinone biosynthesis C-methylase UbiE
MEHQPRSGAFVHSSIPEAFDRYLLRAIFEPWADDLVGRAGVQTGHSVLDVASGTGSVARRAAQAVGASGRVVASDISPGMLALAASKPVSSDWAWIEYVECSATALEVRDGEFDVVICQQGLQFFPDRGAAVAEMCRAAGPGGRVVVATWAAEYPVGLFGPMAECLRDAGLAEPYPGAFEVSSYVIGTEEVAALFQTAGLEDIKVATLALDAVWASQNDAANTVHGTPFGPGVSALAAPAQARIRAMLLQRLGARPDGPVTVRTVCNVASGRNGASADR